MWSNPKGTADLVTFTEVILKGMLTQIGKSPYMAVFM